MSPSKSKTTAPLIDKLAQPAKSPDASAVAHRTVGIVEDKRGLRESYVRLIDHAPGMSCIGSWPNGKSALAQLPALRPDVVLMDINMPGMSGIECTAKLKPLCLDTKVIMVTVYGDAENIFPALQAGASGYLLKSATSEEILEAINEVCNGGAPMTSDIACKVVQAFRKPMPQSGATYELSPREKQILELLSQGFINKEIADQLHISYFTVKEHVKHIYDKLHVRSCSEAVVKFVSDKNPLSVPPKPSAR